MECEYAKFGCKVKLANEDHFNAHLRDSAAAHLRIVALLLEKEMEKNKAMEEKLDVLCRVVKDSAAKETARVVDPPKRDSWKLGDRIREVVGEKVDQKKEDITSPPQAVTSPPVSPAPVPASSSPALSPSAPTSAIAPSNVSSPPTDDRDYLPIRRTQSSLSFSGQIGKRRTEREVVSLVPPTGPSDSNLIQPNPSGRERRNSHRKSGNPVVESEFPEGFERGIIWEYDPSTDEWARGQLVFKMESKAFAEGALRHAHMVEIISAVEPVESPPDANILGGKSLKSSIPLEMKAIGEPYVAKISKVHVPVERYFEDVKMQCVVRELAIKFNNQGTPKKVEFLMAWVLEIPRANETILVGLEPHIAGDFQKITNNLGLILQDRNTPQAFSHFTWEHSAHNLVVVDLQGVDDFYTDPQVHTKGGKDYGLGNLGMKGIENFLKTHKCNQICVHLNLPLLNVDSSTTSRRRLLRGTMKAPNIEKDLDAGPPLPSIAVPENLKGGEFQCTQTLTGHDDRVVCVTIHKQQMFSSTADGTVKVWALPGNTCINTIRAHRKSVESMCFSDKYLFTASADHAIKVWDLTDFTLVERLRDHSGEVNVVAINGDTLLSASFDKSIKVWSVSNLKCTNTLEGHSKSVKCLLSVGNIVLSGSNDGTIKVWSLAKMQCIFSVEAHEQIWVKALAIHKFSLYSGAHDSLIKEWDLKNFASAVTIKEHTDNITALLATKQFLVSASEDKSIRIWNYADHKCLAVLKGHRSGVQSLCTDGKNLYSASDDYTIKVWKWVEK